MVAVDEKSGLGCGAASAKTGADTASSVTGVATVWLPAAPAATTSAMQIATALRPRGRSELALCTGRRGMRLRDVSVKKGGHHMFRAAADRKMHNAQCKTRDTERTAQKCNCCQRYMVKKPGVLACWLRTYG